jgi:hypothetical protein
MQHMAGAFSPGFDSPGGYPESGGTRGDAIALGARCVTANGINIFDLISPARTRAAAIAHLLALTCAWSQRA